MYLLSLYDLPLRECLNCSHKYHDRLLPFFSLHGIADQCGNSAQAEAKNLKILYDHKDTETHTEPEGTVYMGKHIYIP